MTKQTLTIYWQATWHYKRLFLTQEIAATFATVANNILGPLIISQIINKLTRSQGNLTFSSFDRLLVLFVLVQAVYFVGSRLMMQSYIRIEPRVLRDLEQLCFKKFQSHSIGFFADNFSGALVTKVTKFTSSYQQSYDIITGDFGLLARRFIAALIVIFFLNSTIALFFLAWTIFFCGSIVYLHRKKLPMSKASTEAQTRVTARLADVITNTLTIKSFSRQKHEDDEFRDLTQQRKQLRYTQFQFGDKIRAYKQVTIISLSFIVLLMSIHFTLNGGLAVGSVVLIQFYLLQLISQLWDFGRFIDRLEECLADAAEMTEILLLPEEIKDPTRPEAPRIKDGSIEFRDVTFNYADADQSKTLFKNLSFRVKAGQKVGLVGPSGGGKTSITKLLLRFMDIQGGQILIDGQGITTLKQEDLRRHIAYVPQESLLFHRTINENITYAHPTANESLVLDAATNAHAQEFIGDLPKQYKTMVGERGVKLSGGQRQRIAIARAMLKKAPILILDEATSSLDSSSEKYIIKALDKLMTKRTTLVIAHRLSTIRKLDRILVMDKGQIMEDGSHDELIAAKGLYAELWAHQSGNFLGDD